jgi:tRNA-dihydrouridine synthase 4
MLSVWLSAWFSPKFATFVFIWERVLFANILMEPNISILRLSKEKESLNIAAPMVRYSKLAFRETVRKYNANVCFTPMILSDVFKHSNLSRQAELTTCKTDNPLIIQFAASNSLDASDAAELVAKYSSGVDINCGCPQSWAFQEGIGSYLLTKPEIVQDIVDQTKRRTAKIKMDDGTSFPVSIKIRIDQDIRKTVDLCQRAEKMGFAIV